MVGTTKWPKMPLITENNNLFSIAAIIQADAKQLLTFMNGQEEPTATSSKPREHLPRRTAEAVLQNLMHVCDLVLKTPTNDKVLRAIEALSTPVHDIKASLEVVKHQRTGPIGAWRNPLNMAKAPSTAQISGSSSKPTPPILDNKAARELTIKTKTTNPTLKALSQEKLMAFIQKSIDDHHTSPPVLLEAAQLLRSGDLRIWTKDVGMSDTLKRANPWLTRLGDCATVVIPTYGVVAGWVSTRTRVSTDEEKKRIADRIVRENNHKVPGAEIRYVGWLNPRKAMQKDKKEASLVIEFAEAKHARIAITEGLAWEGRLHDCTRYVREARVLQCLRCCKPGHLTNQCRSPQSMCSYCAETHESRGCPNRSKPGFQPKCALCGKGHEARNPKCEKMQPEYQRAQTARAQADPLWPEATGTGVSSVAGAAFRAPVNMGSTIYSAATNTTKTTTTPTTAKRQYTKKTSEQGAAYKAKKATAKAVGAAPATSRPITISSTPLPSGTDAMEIDELQVAATQEGETATGANSTPVTPRAARTREIQPGPAPPMFTFKAPADTGAKAGNKRTRSTHSTASASSQIREIAPLKKKRATSISEVPPDAAQKSVTSRYAASLASADGSVGVVTRSRASQPESEAQTTPIEGSTSASSSNATPNTSQ